MKVASTIAEAQKALAAGYSVVIALQLTGEAAARNKDHTDIGDIDENNATDSDDASVAAAEYEQEGRCVHDAAQHTADDDVGVHVRAQGNSDRDSGEDDSGVDSSTEVKGDKAVLAVGPSRLIQR
jgi:hypothetical protein